MPNNGLRSGDQCDLLPSPDQVLLCSGVVRATKLTKKLIPWSRVPGYMPASPPPHREEGPTFGRSRSWVDITEECSSNCWVQIHACWKYSATSAPIGDDWVYHSAVRYVTSISHVHCEVSGGSGRRHPISRGQHASFECDSPARPAEPPASPLV